MTLVLSGQDVDVEELVRLLDGLVLDMHQEVVDDPGFLIFFVLFALGALEVNDLLLVEDEFLDERLRLGRNEAGDVVFDNELLAVIVSVVDLEVQKLRDAQDLLTAKDQLGRGEVVLTDSFGVLFRGELRALGSVILERVVDDPRGLVAALGRLTQQLFVTDRLDELPVVAEIVRDEHTAGQVGQLD